MKIILILLLTTLTGLPPLYSQNTVYHLRFDSTFALDNISVMTEPDPRMWKWDSLWTTGQEEVIRLDQKKLESSYIIIGWKGVNFLFEKGMLTGSGFDDLNNMRIASEFQGLFNQANEIDLWVSDNIYGQRGKRKIKNTREFLGMSNARIVEIICQEHLAPVEVPPFLDRWLWRNKMNAYLSILSRVDVEDFPGFLGAFHNYEQRDSAYWYPYYTMGMMAFASYMELIGKASDMLKSIETHERDIRINPGKMYYVYKYASLLYTIKKNYAMPIGVTGSEKIQYIKVDTSLIYYPGNIELDYVRKFIREKTRRIDLHQRVFVSEFDKESLEELIHKDIIVIDFWGTWCKPCIENMPKLDQAAAQHAEVQFISLARDKMKSWNRYVKKHPFENLEFALIDGDPSAIYSPGVNVFPTYLIIDSTGEILHGPVHTVDDVKEGLSQF